MDIARITPTVIDDLAGIKSLKAWQILEFGRDIIRCIK